MFENQPPFARIDSGRECGFFDHETAAASLLVERYAVDLAGMLLREKRHPRIQVAGDGNLILKLLGVLVTQCQYAEAGLPGVELLTVDQDAVAREFPLNHPQMALVADLYVRQLLLPRLLRVELRGTGAQAAMSPYDLAFVACREDSDTLSLATNLAQQHG